MKRNVLLVLAAVAVLAIGSAAIASNMGFKISITLTKNVNSFVSIPYYNSYTDAASLRNDINAAISGTATVLAYNGTLWQKYAGGGVGQVNFTITPGQGYQVVPAASGNWIVVGSHNPSLALSFTKNVNNFVSVPYHTTATTAQLLRNEIDAAIGSTVTVLNYNGTLWQKYAGGGVGQVNFNITAGSAVQVVPAGSGSWTPAHY
jgi:riboflavin biosynthesis pyrimidine reductase